MPIYEYVCEDCHNKFDSLRSFKDADAHIVCHYCQSVNTKRVLSVFFAQSGGKPITSRGASGCSSSGGGNCASCG